MTPEEIIRNLIDTLEKSVNDFNESIPAIQKQIASEIELFIKDLEISGDTIKSNVSNLRKIAAFKSKIERIIQNSDYSDNVNEFIKTFNEVALIQNKYFTTLSADFKPSKVLEEIKVQSIDGAIESLTEAGLNANLINPVHDILLKNVTSGGSFSQLAGQVRNFIQANPDTVGALERYTTQVTTDSLNQFSAQYTHLIADDLSLNWFMYDGSLIKTSRPFCEACVKKKYIHRSEFPRLLKGDFPEFKEEGGVIYDKTGLPSGMIDGTNANNLPIYRGGYNCGHQMIPVQDSAVPNSVKAKLNA